MNNSENQLSRNLKGRIFILGKVFYHSGEVVVRKHQLPRLGNLSAYCWNVQQERYELSYSTQFSRRLESNNISQRDFLECEFSKNAHPHERTVAQEKDCRFDPAN